MDIFFTLLTNLIPLYVLIGIGWLAGRFFEVDRNTLANLAIFIMLPIVVFGFVLKLDFQASYFLLPIVIYAVQASIGLAFLWLGRKIYDGAEANILAMAASMGNTGYFGLPLVLLIFPPEQVAIYIFAMMGGSVYEATIGYYIAARGRFDVRTSLIKLAKFPTLYAIVLAFIVRSLEINMPVQFDLYWGYFKGAYVLIGMMIIGAALAKVKNLVVGPRFLSLAFAGKFVAWPALVLLFTALDQSVFGLFEPEIHKLLLIMALVPTAANVAAFASQLDLVPEKAATTILFSTIFALFYIPFILMISGV